MYRSIINDAIAATSNLVENEDKNENGDGNQKDKESTSTSSIFSTTTPHDLSRNLMEVLLRIKVPASSGNVFISDKKESLTVSVQRKQLSCCWDEFLKLSFPVDVYKNALIHMQQHILPALSSPLLMADFLTDSYNLGGIISILALEGLFTLIARHNLDYPHFFHKLYRLLTPEVFYARYRTKFYSLLSLFLTSTHLPSYLVAAFAKRLARLALSAPPSGCVFSVALIFNLLRRHPACRYLIHNPLEEANNEGEKGKGVAGADNKTSLVLSRLGLNLAAAKAKAEEKAEEEAEEEEVKGEDNDDQDNDEEAAEESSDEEEMPPGVDPYDHNEEDPALSQANESSLWELKSLCNHYIPAVSRLAKVFFEANVPKKDYDMKEEQFSAQSYETMFHTELVWRKNQNTPMAFEVPQTLFDFDKDDRVFADNFF